MSLDLWFLSMMKGNTIYRLVGDLNIIILSVSPETKGNDVKQ